MNLVTVIVTQVNFQQKNLCLLFRLTNGKAYNQKKFVITIKKRPLQSYRLHLVLPKNLWTPVLAENFWEHTQLPCCISFCRAKVYPQGSYYIKVTGKCSACESHFEGIIFKRPGANSR